MEDTTLLPTTTELDENTAAIAQRIMAESDVDKVRELTTLFNLNSQKRNVVRIMKMAGLLDKVTDQVIKRVEKTPDNFSNDELLRYMQAAEASIDKASKNLNLVDEAPTVVITNNTQINVADNGLNRESRQRVFDAVKDIMNLIQSRESETYEEDDDLVCCDEDNTGGTDD